VGLGFAMVSIAGAASMIGFLPVMWVRRTRPSYLAFALGFAAGLMMYVNLFSFVCPVLDSSAYRVLLGAHM